MEVGGNQDKILTQLVFMYRNGDDSGTYDHTHWKTRDPVRSPIDKPVRGGLVVGSVTTSESPLLYVFFAPFLFLI